MAYNGWTNRETWLVALHFEFSTLEYLEVVKGYVSEAFDEIENPFVRDYIDASKINWQELREHCDDYQN